MGNVYIATENPNSWLGDKEENLGDKAPTTKQKPDKTVLYLNRSSQVKLTKQNVETRKLIELSHKINKGEIQIPDRTVGIAVAGSLTSMLARLKHFASNSGSVSVLIFLGHGNESTIATGSGHMNISYEDTLIGSLHREISVNNITSWKPTFKPSATRSNRTMLTIV